MEFTGRSLECSVGESVNEEHGEVISSVQEPTEEVRGFNLKCLEMFCDVCCLFFVYRIVFKHQQLGSTFNL